VVSAETIGESMRDIKDPQACVERLVQLALRGGGPDNITVVVADATDADIVEQAPIVGGAAARDRGNSTVADASSAAARAAALQAPPRPAQPSGPPYDRDEPEPQPKRHPVRTSLLLLVLLGILGGGLYLGWQYTQKQYYVGATEQGQLAIFRGVPGQIAGLDLSSVNETSPARLDDLTSVAQDRVKQGIHAADQPDARRMLQELTSDEPSNPNLKPICVAGSAAPTVSEPVTPSGTPSAAGKTSSPGRPTSSSAPALAPTITPDALPSESAPPVVDPVGCRPVD
jgi:protein phosphatase